MDKNGNPFATVVLYPELEPCGRADCPEQTQFALEIGWFNDAGEQGFKLFRLCPEHIAAFLRDSQAAPMRLGD